MDTGLKNKIKYKVIENKMNQNFKSNEPTPMAFTQTTFKTVDL